MSGTLDDKAFRRFHVKGRDPDNWRQHAADLHQAAAVLWGRLEPPPSAVDTGIHRTDWIITIGKVTLMLEGLALEALAKAVLIREAASEYIRDGRWRGPRHALVAIARDAKLPLKGVEDEDLLARLAAFVKWAGRYPIPMDYQQLANRVEGARHILAPGTYYSTEDQERIERLYFRWSEHYARIGRP